ncbi:MAG: hypothetical protein K8953_08285 [Proteobacteria bacterium]|nr:hypothetical protein [Pseudomonadota bacterium]
MRADKRLIRGSCPYDLQNKLVEAVREALKKTHPRLMVYTEETYRIPGRVGGRAAHEIYVSRITNVEWGECVYNPDTGGVKGFVPVFEHGKIDPSVRHMARFAWKKTTGIFTRGVYCRRDAFNLAVRTTAAAFNAQQIMDGPKKLVE